VKIEDITYVLKAVEKQVGKEGVRESNRSK
jgi:hypothetical protein